MKSKTRFGLISFLGISLALVALSYGVVTLIQGIPKVVSVPASSGIFSRLESLSLVDVEFLEVEGFWDISIDQSEKTGLFLPKDFPEDKIAITKKGKTLYIKNNGNPFDGTPMNSSLKISLNSLKELILKGAVTAKVAGFSGTSLVVDLEGAGKVEGKTGTFENLTLRVAGASSVDFSELKTKNAKVDLKGASQGLLFMDGGILEGKLEGLVHLRYFGTAQENLIKDGALANVERLED